MVETLVEPEIDYTDNLTLAKLPADELAARTEARYQARRRRIEEEVDAGITPQGLAGIYLDRTLLDTREADTLYRGGGEAKEPQRVWQMNLAQTVKTVGRRHPSVFPPPAAFRAEWVGKAPQPLWEQGELLEFLVEIGRRRWNPATGELELAARPRHGRNPTP